MQEVRQIRDELVDSSEVQPQQARVGLIFDYDADAAWAVQPHGAGLDYFGLVFDAYKALRKLGLSIDILRPETRDFAGYDLILAPGVMHMSDDLKQALSQLDAQVLMGPRTAARDQDMTIPVPLPPAIPGLDITVDRVESLRPDCPEALSPSGAFKVYREVLTGAANVTLRTEDGLPAVMSQGPLHYLAGWPDAEGWKTVLTPLCAQAGLEVIDLPEGLRRRDTATETFWFNYAATPQQLGGRVFEPASVVRDPRT